MFDVVRALRPTHVVVENVAALLDDADAFGWLLGDLADIGMDAEWGVLSACSVGAPHTRERLLLVAYAHGEHGPSGLGARIRTPAVPERGLRQGTWADPVDGFVAADGYGRRVADGLSAQLEPSRVRAVGNAVVPQVAEHVGRLILAADREAVTA
jgi:DNA (cytosine-5)-methyltransferase 1